MADSATIILRDLTTGAGRTGLTVKLRRRDDNFATDYLTATEVISKPGVYQFDNVPFNKYKLWVNGSEDNSFGGTNGRWWPVSELTELSYLKLDGSNAMEGGLDMNNHRIYNVDDPATDADVGDRGYNDARYVDKANAQSVSGEKTFSNIIIDVGNNEVTAAKFQVKAASNPPNGGVVGLKAGYQANNRMLFDFQSSEVKLPDPTSSTHAVTKQYVDNNFVDKTNSQGISGEKTFANIIIDVGTNDISSPKFQIRQASNPPNGGIVGFKAGYRSINKMLFDFLASEVDIEDLKIKITSNKYITGSPSQNDYVWKKWVVDNFEPLGVSGGFNSNTVIVDPRVPESTELKIYPTITDAITSLSAIDPPPASNNVWTIIVRQHYLLSGYNEDLTVPDWINIIGEGSVLIAGSLYRAASSETGITSKLVNLHFESDGDKDVNRIEVINCIFTAISDNVVLTKCKIKNSGFYAGTAVTSGGNNKIINCFGGYDVAWESTDKVYRYDLQEGDIY